MVYNSIDLFSGCGGLTSGMHRAGFSTKVAIEVEKNAALTYSLNHPNTFVIQDDIRNINSDDIRKHFDNQPIHLLAGCPPCQGFSSIRRLNRTNIKDKRNSLVLEYLRLVKELRPYTIMMENVPGLQDYYLFDDVIKELRTLGYNPKVNILNVKNYGVPQNRRRLVMVGSLLGNLEIAEGINVKVTVRDTIEKIESVKTTTDPIHKIFPKHTPRVLEKIKATPQNGGSRKDLPGKYTLACHKKKNVGFNDVYGRLRWDDFSTTITGGCLNPSKGRFLHPTEDRCISAREAALLQSFAPDYKFPADITHTALALLIGNALPPKFSYYQSLNIYNHLKQYLG